MSREWTNDLHRTSPWWQVQAKLVGPVLRRFVEATEPQEIPEEDLHDGIRVHANVDDWLVVSNIFYFHPYLGKTIHFD